MSESELEGRSREEIVLEESRRAEVLAQCKEAKAAWDAKPGRNLVLFFDGTGNILGNSADTNVVKLMHMLVKRRPYVHAQEQIVYYDPGVGTTNEFPPAGFFARTRSLWQLVKGLALGQGAFENIAEGYEFLCRTYAPGDRIWLFGFSRGAFTARAVGGMVNMYGLVYPSGLSIVRTLVRTYFANTSPERNKFASDVIEHFSLGRTPLIHFSGMWDTVEAIGLTSGVAITNSTSLTYKRFAHIRHALALHETRHMYRAREYAEPQFTTDEKTVRSFKQIWFRGVHSDIGGSYRESGLSNITLNWMVNEARFCGLEINDVSVAPEDPNQRMHDQTLDSPYWVLSGLNTRDRSKVGADIHASASPVQDARPARRSAEAWFVPTLGIELYLIAAMLLVIIWNLDGARAIDVDFALIAVYAVWLPIPAAWAIRRWGTHAIRGGYALPGIAGKVQLALVGAPLADLCENLVALQQPQDGWLRFWLAFFSTVKFEFLAWTALVVAAGASRQLQIRIEAIGRWFSLRANAKNERKHGRRASMRG
ncbi:DUF2235 domain-containing protein [Variovorax saccharolyticus]|uniref:DUF2235 domain-containing protein n=1 Tax=Variovorax saccharolyticus TaxID=3053516 RepID=UPI002575481A|nr:DUF2235 domain-containing protein [Variovorax sp. J22R187]MDM0022095.1 DUF2235 domain-containing protein [Variovorax sp. J22R187]